MALSGWAVGLLAAMVLGCSSRPAADPPAVILIVADTLRADYLGSYGREGGVSPNLDAFARESVLFERCYAQAPWTKPSMASLLTGVHPSEHGVRTHQGYGSADRRGADAGGDRAQTDVLSAHLTTLAEWLGQQGYATGAFVANPWLLAEYGFAQGFDEFDTSYVGNTVPAEGVLAAAERWIDSLPRGTPYFALVHLMDAHGPYDAAAADLRAVAAVPVGPEVTFSAEQHGAIPRYLSEPGWTREPAGRSLRGWRHQYAAGVHALDRQLGGFLQWLRSRSEFDRSLIVFTADHGEELREHGGWGHGRNLYDHQLRVPLLVRLPGARDGGRRVAKVASLIDLFPTVVDVVEGSPPEMDGRSLLALASPQPSASFATAVVPAPNVHAVTAGRYRLIENTATGATLLFDLSADAEEQIDLSASSPELVKALSELLGDHLADRVNTPADRATIPAELEDRLRALGYLEP